MTSAYLQFRSNRLTAWLASPAGGAWRKLSGPASSGERAPGLTVPLFAAVASFFSQGSYALARHG